MKRRIPVIVMLFTWLLGLFGCGAGPAEPAVSAESLTLTVRGMRGTVVYQWADEGETSRLTRYRETYSGEEWVLQPEKQVCCPAGEMLRLMNDCGVSGWNGFHGKHPKNVQDGDMFVFQAAINQGESIRAEGSANFPKGYREFVAALNRLLSESDEKDRQ